MQLELKYGCNPNQSPASISLDGASLPIRVLNGMPGYINLMDALNGWQLVRELAKALAYPAAASFKHVSPAGAAIGLPVDETLKSVYFSEESDPSPLCCAYMRARGADRLSSFVELIAQSESFDVSTAKNNAKEVSDGIIAPGYDPAALALLKTKRKGAYTILEIDPAYEPGRMESREIFGLTFTQSRNAALLTPAVLSNIVTTERTLPETAKRDLTLAMITLKYTQSNSVCYAKDGQAIGIGAGQQSRVHCTRLAGNKADLWHLRRHPATLALPFLDDLPRPQRDNAIDLYLLPDEDAGELFENDMWRAYFKTMPKRLDAQERAAWLFPFQDVSLASDAFFPFEDNIRRAARSGVRYIAQPGGSIRDAEIIAACNARSIAMVFTGFRLFHH